MNEAERMLLDFTVQQHIFDIDTEGRIWRNAAFWSNGRSGIKIVPIARKRAERPAGKGYLQLRCGLSGRYYIAPAHRIVWIYFFGDIPEGMEVNHKDGIKTRNHPSNLELLTHAENLEHAAHAGLWTPFGINSFGSFPGESHPNAKLSEADVRKILMDYQSGNVTQEELAREYSVSAITINHIICRRNWRHIQK